MVPVVDLSRRGRRLAPAFARAAERVASSGHFLLGPETERFEHDLAGFAGGGEAVAVASGAGAIQLALAALGVGPGAEVLVPAFTAVPTASAVCAVGARPVFVDVDPATGCLDADAAIAACTSRTAAAVVVHLYGYPSALPDLPVPIVEDAAQAHGALHDPGRSAATCYSFYPTKNLGGIGDGGAVVSTDHDLVADVRRRRVHGMEAQYVHHDVSQNFRMSELEAAWLSLAMPELAGEIERRRHIAARYRHASPHLRWQATDPSHAYHLCVFTTDDRDDHRQRLADSGVATAIHYPLALDQQPAYVQFAGAPCVNARRWADQCVSVPCFGDLTDGEIEVVATALGRLDS